MRKDVRGFTLTEILIALAILGTVITAVLGLFLVGSKSLKEGRTRRDVTWIMEKKFSEVKHLYLTYPYDRYPSGVTPAQINAIVTNASEILPGTTTVPLWYSSSLSSISGTETINETDYNFIISFYSDIDEIKQVGIVILWNDPASGEGKETSSTIFISKEM